MQNQQMTIQGQIDSAKSAEEEKRKTKESEMDIERERTKINADANNKTAIVNMVAGWLKPSADGAIGQVPPQYQPIVDAVMQNIAVSALAQTEEQKQMMVQKMQEAQMQQMAEQQQAQQQIQQPQPEQQMVA